MTKDSYATIVTMPIFTPEEVIEAEGLVESAQTTNS